MNQSLFEKFGVEKLMLFIIIIAIVVVFGVVFYLFFGYSSRSLEVLSPLGREQWEIGQTYEIKWKSRGVEKIGIALFNGENPEWIAEGVSASKGSYEWKIQPGHEYGPNFWIAVFEYPWKKGNQLSYSNGSFSITYPELASCDGLSVEREWPFLASDTPNARRIFITKEDFTGDLGGLDGANEKCKIAAAELGLSGDWTAFLGGENPEDTAIKRIEKTPRGTAGIFIDAQPSLELLRGATCNRLLGKDFNEFIKKLSDSEAINKAKLSADFMKLMRNVWFGRINENSVRSCTFIESLSNYLFTPLAEKYSYTVTCRNWSYGEKTAEGYSKDVALNDTFPSCYTPQGELTFAVGTAGLSSAFKGQEGSGYFVTSVGRFCLEKKHLLCIED